jgi:hypothetical protein
MGHCSDQSRRAAPLGSRLGPSWSSITCWQGQSLDLAEHQPSDVTIAMLAGFCTMLMAAALPSLRKVEMVWWTRDGSTVQISQLPYNPQRQSTTKILMRSERRSFHHVKRTVQARPPKQCSRLSLKARLQAKDDTYCLFFIRLCATRIKFLLT